MEDTGAIERQDTLPGEPSSLLRNHEEMVSVLRGGERFGTHGDGRRELTLTIEEVLKDRANGTTVTYEGAGGLAQVLEHMRQFFPGHGTVTEQGRLLGLAGPVAVDGGEVDMAVSLEAGGQIACTVGPTTSVVALRDALDTFERWVHVASREIGCDYELVAEGYNPLVRTPLDIPLVPSARYAVLNAQLASKGAYARDAMRCCCSTQVRIDYGDEKDAIATYRLAVALSPVLTFLTDNSRGLRQQVSRDARLTRSVVWSQVDERRCGVVPGTFSPDFGFDSYVSWVEGTEPLLFVDSTGETSATGRRTAGDIMAERPLSDSEVMCLFSTALPDVRFMRNIELRQMDALRPRMAAGVAAFVKGIFYSDQGFAGAQRLVGEASEAHVVAAAGQLRQFGWSARVYGRPVGELVDALLSLAREGLADPQERAALDEIALLWDVRMVPRDSLIRNSDPDTIHPYYAF